MSAPFRCIGALGCVGLLLGFGRLAGLFGIDERDVMSRPRRILSGVCKSSLSTGVLWWIGRFIESLDMVSSGGGRELSHMSDQMKRPEINFCEL